MGCPFGKNRFGRELVNPIYQHRNLLFFRGFFRNPSFFINQPMGIWDITHALDAGWFTS
jgi:hypothetical protein